MNPDYPQQPFQPNDGSGNANGYGNANNLNGANNAGTGSAPQYNAGYNMPSSYGSAQQSDPVYGQAQYYNNNASNGAPIMPQQANYASPPPIGKVSKHRHDPTKKFIILMCVFIFTTVACIGVAAWAYVNYLDQKNNVDIKVSDAVSLAVKNQKEEDYDDFEQAEKQPNRTFAGPSDYGSLSFMYPKTWSAYEIDDASEGGDYQAIFTPGVLPPEADDQQYALRVSIENESYDNVVSSYEDAVEDGELKTTSVTVNDQSATRLEGVFSDDIRGAAVIFKIRDKTVTLRTDADTFIEDFDALVDTVTFVK